MAGKHYDFNLDSPGGNVAAGGDQPPIFPGSYVDRAIAEGRQAFQDLGSAAASAANPHPAGSEANAGWQQGVGSGLNADIANDPLGDAYQTFIPITRNDIP